MALTIRPMTRADIDPAADVILAGGWGDRRAHLDFSIGRPFCQAFVAEHEGLIVGTAMSTTNGEAGWVGLVFVAPDHRGRGLGAELTAAAVEVLEKAGCRTLLLVATEQGRRVYERFGFVADTSYEVFSASGLPAAALDPAIRTLSAADTEAVVAADRAATGEDRSKLIASVLETGGGWCMTDEAGRRIGHVLRPPFRGASTIAADPDVALRLLDHRRRAAGPQATVRTGILAENAEGRRWLEAAGWTHDRTHPRLIRGEPLTWQPAAIWGQFNFALG
jgi:predicted N-acetyltransferase YhbS